jgi:ABC-type branched-subunit amino acid transport system substrate-binding protein
MKNRMAGGMLTALLVGLLVVGLTAGPAEARKLKILTTTGMSGPLAAMGQGYDKAIQLAVDEINAAGMKGGWEGIDYKVVDSETKPSVMQQKLLREGKRWKPDMVMGAILETTIRVWHSQLPKLKIPGFVGGHEGMAKFMPPGEVPMSEWVFYYGFPEYWSGYMAGRALHDLGAKRVGYIGGDYDWGYGQSIGLKAYWLENGKPFDLVMIGYTPLDKADLSTEVLQIKDAKLDAIFCSYTGAGWWALPKMLKDAQAMPKYFVYECSYGTMGMAKITGAYGAEGVYSIADHNPESQAWKDWIKKWRDKFGEKAYPEMYTHNYYQGTYWAVRAFEKVGADNKDPMKIIKALQTHSFQNVCVSPMGPTDNWGGNIGAKASLVQFVKGGKPEFDPSVDLHPELRAVYDLPKWNSKDLKEKMQKLGKMEKGEEFKRAQ